MSSSNETDTADRWIDTAFLRLSSSLTGFDVFRLEATGQARPYLDTVRTAAGDGLVDDLLRRSADIHAVADADPETLERALRIEILGDDRFGPLARNIIKMWFVGTWYALPAAWHAAHGGGQPNTTFVVSPASYTEGLLWPSIGTNPPGAKAPGYASWVDPPRIPA